MRRVTLCTVAVAMMLCCAMAMARERPEEVRRALQALENRANAAAARKNVDAVLRTLTTDFRATDHRGRVQTRAQLAQQLRQVFQTVESFRATGTVSAVRVTRPGAATATVRTKGTLVSRDPATGQRVRLEMEAVSEDTFVRTRGEWLRRTSRTRTVTARRDGQPVEIP